MGSLVKVEGYECNGAIPQSPRQSAAEPASAAVFPLHHPSTTPCNVSFLLASRACPGARSFCRPFGPVHAEHSALPLPPYGPLRTSLSPLPGVVRFVGRRVDDGKSRVGVELRKPVGKNNGTVGGHRYFECAPNHGVLAIPGKVKKIPKPASSAKKKSAKKKAAGSEADAAVPKKKSAKRKVPAAVNEADAAVPKKKSAKKKVPAAAPTRTWRARRAGSSARRSTRRRSS